MQRRFQSIHHRMFILFLFCMSGIVLAVSLLFYNRTTVQFHDKISDLARKNVSQTAGLFDLLLNSYNSLTKSITNNLDLVRLLGTETDHQPEAVAYINERTITNILGAIYYSREDLIGIHVLKDSGKVYNYGNYMNVIDPEYMHAEWYKEIKKSAGKIAWLGVYPHSVIDQMEKRPVFAFGRQLYDLDEHKPIGIVLIEAEPKSILAALHNLRLGPNSEVYLMGQEGRIVSSTSVNPPPSLESLQAAGGDDIIVERSDQQVVIASRLPYADWSVISVTPNRDLNVELAQTQRFLLIVAPVLIILSALIALVVSRSISQPLKRLIREMKLVETGNFRRRLEVTSYQEVNQLVDSFNHMVGRIEELIELVKISSVSEKNAELHALQTQVNPHFLYNTLDMIYWLLDEKGQDQLGEVVLALSHLFRYSSHWEEGAEVTLREEVEQMGHYLTIIQARLEGRVTVLMEISERWMDIRIPKMTLQPLIENAVKHGLEPLELSVRGELHVRAEEAGNTLRLTIADNGVGITSERLIDVRYALANPGKQSISGRSGHIGLQNLQMRLHHMFGKEFGLGIAGKPGKGTVITVTIPLPKERKSDEYTDS
ncbi:cache domain-containing sensor histidine kinase [Paenibacillus medicaginis]|uniref:Sensor histidine kinase n=1 Tax=Paenibacillus medicaginis TaxID=1470560 RepID=A0ABV5C488_9BACL